MFRESIAQKIADLRTVDGLMATRAPAGPATQKRVVIYIADINSAGGRLLLEMAAQAKRGVARDQQSGINAPMRIVAGDAAFVHRLMLKHKRTGLRRVALGTDFILRHEFRAAAFNHRAFMGIVAIGATHFAFDDRMVRRQIEFSLFIQMALETDLG